jgi:hypothetical protein
VLGVFCVNDNLEVDFENNQMMRCILCYQNLVIRINPRIQVRKGLIFYYKTNEFFYKKNVYVEHILIAKRFEKERNNVLKVIEERQPLKKRANMFVGAIFKFFL